MQKIWMAWLLMIFSSLLFQASAGISGSTGTSNPDKEDDPESGRFWVSPYAGVMFYGGLEPLPNTGFFSDLPRPSSVLIGIRLSRRVTQSLVLEATVSRSATENVHDLIYEDPDPLEGNPRFARQKLTNSIDPVLRLGGNVLYLLPMKGTIVPHVTAGLGWIHHSARDQVAASIVILLADGTVFADTIGVPESNVRIGSQDWLSLDLGGGLSGDLTQALAIRIDVILHFSRFSQLDVDGPLTGDVFYAGPRWVNDLELATGVIFRF